MLRGTARIILAFAPALAGCAHEELTYRAPAAALAAVVPAGGAVAVDPAGTVVISFTQPLAAGMERFAALHAGDLSGDVVPGAWTLSPDRSTLTFAPAAPLARAATHTIHLGGSLKDSHGQPVDLGPGRILGGQWVTAAMLSAAMPGSAATSMVGYGWLAPDGTYGMIFRFTTV